MRLDTTPHPFYCGIDLHARTMYVCILDQSGEVLVHRKRKTDPHTFLQALPHMKDRRRRRICSPGGPPICADGDPFGIGHALYMKAIYGRQAKMTDRLTQDCGLLGRHAPQAYLSNDAPPDLRRRMPLAYGRLLAHVNIPSITGPIGNKIASSPSRRGRALPMPPCAHGRAGLITYDDALLGDVARPIVHTARHRCPYPVLRQTVRPSRCSASCCSTHPHSCGSPGARIASPIVAWSNAGIRRRSACLKGPTSAMPSKWPLLLTPVCS
jgi:hypothetical protein